MPSFLDHLFYTTNENGLMGWLEAGSWLNARRKRLIEDQKFLTDSNPLFQSSYLAQSPLALNPEHQIAAQTCIETFTASFSLQNPVAWTEHAEQTISTVIALDFMAAEKSLGESEIAKFSVYLNRVGRSFYSQSPWHPNFRSIDYLATLVALLYVGTALDKKSDWAKWAYRYFHYEYWSQFNHHGWHRSHLPLLHHQAVKFINAGLSRIKNCADFNWRAEITDPEIADLPLCDFDFEKPPELDSSAAQAHLQMVTENAERSFGLDGSRVAFVPQAQLANPSVQPLDLFLPSPHPQNIRESKPGLFSLSEDHFNSLMRRLRSEQFQNRPRKVELGFEPKALTIQCLGDSFVAWRGPHFNVFVRAAPDSLPQVYASQKSIAASIEVHWQNSGGKNSVVAVETPEGEFSGSLVEQKLAQKLPSAERILFFSATHILTADYKCGKPHYRHVSPYPQGVLIEDFFQL